MKKIFQPNRLFSSVLFIVLISCKSDPLENNQGVFSVDKASLKTSLQEKMGSDNATASALLNTAIDNANIEFRIKGDSIKGIMFFVGQASVLNSTIRVQNDCMIIKIDNSDGFLIPNEKGLLFKNINSETGIQMLKSASKDLSPDTKKAIGNLIQNEKEIPSPIEEERTGEWKNENFVDEFGDKIEKEFTYTYVFGKLEKSSTTDSDIVVKSYINEGRLFFQIENLEKNFPENTFGIIKIKFPSGEVKNEKVAIYKNTISESPDDKRPLIYNHLISDDGELKILFDLSTTNRHYSDEYQFKIKKGNLMEVLSK